MSAGLLFAATSAAVVVAFIIVWWRARAIDNYSIVDAAWAYGFAAVAWAFAICGEGWAPRRALMATLVSLWSLRLGTFLFFRIRAHHPREDGRYQTLRETYAPHVARGFLRFFIIQAISVLLLSVPFFCATQNPSDEFSALELVGAVLTLLALAGESLADHQMNRFKKSAPHGAAVCDVGLWRYSRHPNYFFESCVWWGFYVVSLGSAYGVFTIYAPLFILFLLLKVTGVPPSEAQALRTRGDAFRAYQKRTSAFVPWFPKRGDA